MTTRQNFNLAMTDFAEGKSPEEAAQLHNVTLRTARRWMNQYFDLMGNLRKKSEHSPFKYFDKF
jgi:transposase